MAAPYADFYLLPLPKKNLRAYRRLARAAGRIFRKHGALEYREFVADDLGTMGGTRPMGPMTRLKRDEVLIGAIVGFRSRKHRDTTNRRIMNDPAMGALNMGPLFEMRRVSVGGFRGLLDV